MNETRTFQDFWQHIDSYNAPDLADNFTSYVPHLNRALMYHIMKQEEVGIGHAFHGPSEWAVIIYDFYDSDKELSFRLDLNGRFLLYFHYWDEDGLLKEVEHFLNEEETKGIPDGLRTLMREALLNKKSVVANKKHLRDGSIL